MLITDSSQFPPQLYLAEQVRALDRCAIAQFGIPGLTLMERAGAAAFGLLRTRWPAARHVTVLCGTGNNGGDGFVVARLALQAGLDVRLLQLGDIKKLQGDALASAEKFRQAGGCVELFNELDFSTDLIVDAVLGTGLERAVSGPWETALLAANRHPAPVFALDIPSGLHSDSGRILGCAIRAETTITFIGLKQGMFTGAGPDCCGRIAVDDLEVPSEVYQTVQESARLLRWQTFAAQLVPRRRTLHKGDCGHLLLVGGDTGLLGAVRMAGEAALRTGAGLVSIATRPEHAALIASQRPELMCHGVEQPDALLPLLARADTVAIGPGLGQQEWGQRMLRRVLQSKLPLVVDADALNLLAMEPEQRENWVLTPHPGEAARLLGCTTAEIQADRFLAVSRLQQRYGGVALLKGTGTLISSAPGKQTGLCCEGNPGMASGGMGDLLTGIVGSLVVQGKAIKMAAEMGACLHGAAADLAARAGERGMLATDLLPAIRGLINGDNLNAGD
ncbi:bifunctional ADP-dependent NAD(P)H-hydrate dehydratase/NAD(P)H-hydrate epimerase [Sedimenticola selenatireducens]|uniref:bifunctional ADP-dependent NAD(P)H-hydrate dehydratase/NAD(P)H-hydrate epimerase n=1 Tax=Sedimenticola selenatireducens TaxID=191960 RepID=UPI0004AF0925|nr:bifunctional ADP-dependent NAD(P)H-hydrate dehydratase/NAD(P)H-hydrate epimerase [Sedimenticola selenatireducens]